MIVFKDNPDYTHVFRSEVHGIDFYVPSITGKYHVSRYIAAGAQEIYSSMGATRDTLEKIVDEVLKMCEGEKIKETLRTGVTALMQNLRYRLHYPVDELCAVRMGALLVFMDGEDPNGVNDFYTRRKTDLAAGNYQTGVTPDPDLYDFFLRTGVINTKAYADQSASMNDTAYFRNRTEILNSWSPMQ